MNLSETIKNIRATCENYVDPNLLAFLIDDDNYMGTNNILEIEGYGIEDDDSYEERLLKIHKSENVFLAMGMMTFMPIINECDLFSTEDYNIKLTQEEFNTYADEEEKLFGILIKKDSLKFEPPRPFRGRGFANLNTYKCFRVFYCTVVPTVIFNPFLRIFFEALTSRS